MVPKSRCARLSALLVAKPSNLPTLVFSILGRIDAAIAAEWDNCMFSKFFAKPKINHPLLGELHFRLRSWKGNELAFWGSDAVRVRVPGNAEGVNEEAVSAIEALRANPAALMQECARRLFEEHYLNGLDAVNAGEYVGVEDYPKISSADDIWDHADVLSVIVDPYSNRNNAQVQIGIGTSWDDEHTLGFVVENGKIIEFSMSIPPF